ncbi:MAG: biotin/lipoyl-binding protein [Acidobacteriota bacterium]|nr:biotin/lipoyl-binding protein [Acidobacteriota bacterium]MDH3785371.1 biotin/lipoyl-binding protein [Acidobacteriota bacterium]
MSSSPDLVYAELECVVEETEQGLQVIAPAIGWWVGPPAVGTRVTSDDAVGILERLHRRFRLVLPRHVGGRVVDGVAGKRTRVAIAYGERLLTLDRSAALVTDDNDAAINTASSGRTIQILAPTAGVFYCRSGPDRPPFVTVGDAVVVGQPVGLLEVMKTFSQIVFSEEDGCREARVSEILVTDGQEVRAGQHLLTLEPGEA